MIDVKMHCWGGVVAVWLIAGYLVRGWVGG